MDSSGRGAKTATTAVPAEITVGAKRVADSALQSEFLARFTIISSPEIVEQKVSSILQTKEFTH